jgi:hypothetical protein
VAFSSSAIREISGFWYDIHPSISPMYQGWVY